IYTDADWAGSSVDRRSILLDFRGKMKDFALTRSKKDLNLLSLSDGGSSKRRQRVGEPDMVFLGEFFCESEGKRVSVSSSEGTGKRESGSRASSSISKGKQRSKSGLKGKRVDESDCEVEGELASVSVSKRLRESFDDVPEPIEVIEIDESDDDNGTEEGLKHSEKRFQDVKREEDKNEEGKGSYMSADKVENFGNDGCGFGAENPITFDSDGDNLSEEEHGSDGDNESEEEHSSYGDSQSEEEDSTDADYLTPSSEEGEDEETSDEDFQVDNMSESSEVSFTACDDEEKMMKKKKKLMTKVETESSGICRKNDGIRKGKKIEEGELSNTPSSVNNNECGEQDKDEGKKSDSVEVVLSGCSSKLYEEKAKKQDEKRLKRTAENVDADVEVLGGYLSEDEAQKGTKEQDRDSNKLNKRKKNDANNNANGKEHHDKDTGVRGVSSLLRNKEKIGDSAKVKIMENNKRKEYKDWVRISNRERKVFVDDEIGHEDGLHKMHRMPSRSKEVHLIQLLSECFREKPDSVKDDSNVVEEKVDGVHQPPLKNWLGFKKPEPVVEKSESEKELDMLWEEMETLLRLEKINSQIGSEGTNEARENTQSPAFVCKHDIYLEEQIGLLCRYCSWVQIEIKYMTPPIAPERSRKRKSSLVENVSDFDGAKFNVSVGDSEAACSLNKGTVWDLIPNIKQSLYNHQQEGLEFIWTNLAGTIDLHELKSADPCCPGGCIVSHAPGTGKTRLTMVFLQTYLEVFPKCQPVIIAPANILLTWEDEFKKWDMKIPFHNLNNSELSGKEHADAMNDIDWSRNLYQNKDAIRMVKLYSWFKEKSILGISYHLYEKLAGDVETKRKNRSMKKEKKYAPAKVNGVIMGKVLRDIPGLLILDEGHTPRNQGSLIWKVLSEIQTPKRIILSGTPFQNNFLELYNTLCLVKPSFPEKIPQELKKFCQSRLKKEKKASKNGSWEPVSSGNPADEKINKLKLLMDPFVHVHKGSILQKNLPGLRECVVTLKPDNLQKELLHSIESSQNSFKFEHKLALVSVHPSLFLCCSLSKNEESVVDKDELEKLKMNPFVGVKTRFLVEFVRLCEVFKEKVLVFSQYIDPLSLIMDQLKSVFNWSEGKEVLYMNGKLDQKQKQFLIHSFNDANSQAKILLASTKACSEGINLIGASRVVLLDVVWNPSVERQAISRAYRLGQKRVVYTYHLITQGTTECTKYCKQAEKDRLSELVFSAKNTENDKSESCEAIFEDEVLDRLVRHDKLKDMFGDCVVQPKEREI
ncbi:SNF2 domain-containing protein CLASSY 4-like, partial [Gastrolobium bilobum]|uniref:SNF2 domain-containing protein CLASSY 4-like n=1 Tax=Gastrolobium bilobum TaxID=150636 RepID=UPI002AB0C82B